MHSKDKQIALIIIGMVLFISSMVILGIYQAGKIAFQQKQASESKPQEQIVLPIPANANITAKNICTNWQAEPWNTPLYGSLYRNGSGTNQLIAVFCKNSTKRFEIAYVGSLG